MAVRNRFTHFENERPNEATLYSEKEWGLLFMRPSGIKPMRGNCDDQWKCR